MTIEQRHTKAVAQRIDSSYHKRYSPMRLLRRVLVVVCVLVDMGVGQASGADELTVLSILCLNRPATQFSERRSA